MRQCCDWVRSNVADPAQIAVQDSAVQLTLRVLRMWCLPKAPAAASTATVDATREGLIQAFVSVAADLLSRVVLKVAWPVLDPVFVASLRACVSRSAPLAQTMQTTELSLRTLMGALKPLADAGGAGKGPAAGALNSAVDTLCGFLNICPDAVLPMMLAACRALTVPGCIARVSEAALHVFLGRQSEALKENFQWAPALPYLVLPPAMQEPVIAAAQAQGCVLLLHVHVLQQLSQGDDDGGDGSIVDRALAWLGSLRLRGAATNECAALLMSRLAVTAADQLILGAASALVGRRVVALRDCALALAEDGEFQSLFKRMMQTDNGLPLRLRLFARMLATFLSASLLENNMLRVVQSGGAGAVAEAPSKLSRELLQSLESVASGRRAKYAMYKEQAQYAVNFIADRSHTLSDTREFVTTVLRLLYGDSFVAAI